MHGAITRTEQETVRNHLLPSPATRAMETNRAVAAPPHL